jgi:hypothetical protein
MQRILTWGVVIVTVLVVGVLAYGLVYENVIKARRPVAIVDGVPITTAEYQARVRYERMQAEAELEQMRAYQRSIDPNAPEAAYLLQNIEQRISDLEIGLSLVETRAVEQLIKEELIRQEADRRQIAVAPKDLQQEIERYFGRDTSTPEPTPIATPILAPTEVLTATPTEALTSTEILTPTPTTSPPPTPTVMSEEVFREEYSSFLRDVLRPMGITEEVFRSWFEVDLLTQLVQEDMAAEIPTTAEQVELRILAVDGEERANELATRMDEGEEFEVLKDELEADEESPGYAYDADWFTVGMLEDFFGQALADQVFALPIGAHSEPMSPQQDPSQPSPEESPTLYFIAELLDRDEARELPPYLHQQLTDEAFQEWLNNEQTKVERMEYSDIVSLVE